MTQAESPKSLAGHLLLAMPGIGDPRFTHAVILVCAHDQKGAMGLMLTQPLPGLSLHTLMEQLSITHEGPVPAEIPVLSGGPVESGRGFVLHSAEFRLKDTVVLNDQLAVTGTVDGLHAIARGEGPGKILFMLGYAGWQAGQLEKELQDNAWLTLPADAALIFETPASEKWDTAMRRLGISDPTQLSGTIGRA